MRSYLSLVPISAKVHKRQNRMTIFCIILAVFLVTAVFSMADMGVRMEKERAVSNHGNWHIMLKNISKEDAEQIGSSAGVAFASWYDVINYKINEDYFIGSKKAAICGVEKMFVTDIMNCLTEGSYPQKDNEVMLTANAKDILGVNIGDLVTLNTPSENIDYVISGFTNESSAKVYDAIVMITDISSFNHTFGATNTDNVYYIQFRAHTNMRKMIANIKAQYGLTDENISENTALLGITGFSSNSFMMGMYLAAAVLCLLILTAGVLMIAGSINSNVAERAHFFGMLRCIGASKHQIVRFVRLEALNWCKSAVPIGVMCGAAITWALCAALKFGIGGEFAIMPLFEISAIGIVCGVIVGIVTVLLAAQSPAKHAARVSPVAAVSGCGLNIKNVRHAADTRLCKIETTLGFHHAVSARKNLILMTGSFALSIILFLSFSVVLDFIGHALNPLKPYAPDLSILSPDRSCSINRDFIVEIAGKPGVKRVFGRMFKEGIPVAASKETNKIDLISYEEYQLNWAEADTLDGDLSKVLGNSNYVLTVYDKSNPLTVGDKIRLDSQEVEIACVLSDSPFDSTDTPTVICSEETFTRLTGKQDYAVIDIQLTRDAADEDVNSIRNITGDIYTFSDRREINRSSVGTYWAFRLLVYGFLAIIAMITVFNIINSISMSVSARIKQYGAMRAVGMDGRQIAGMITSEAVTYAVFGCMAGCALGLPLSKFLFKLMITNYWGDAWNIPIVSLVIILLIVAGAVAAAVYTPAKRIQNMAVTDTINEL